jgi:hypothetical protein
VTNFGGLNIHGQDDFPGLRIEDVRDLAGGEVPRRRVPIGDQNPPQPGTKDAFASQDPRLHVLIRHDRVYAGGVKRRFWSGMFAQRPRGHAREKSAIHAAF